ncbi:MAG: hypothetical protein V3V78_02230 [Candidatus Woesearchaeota archaeon]
MELGNSASVDRVACKLYNHFCATHKELFKKDKREYWRQARIYKNERMRAWKYFGTDPLANLPVKKQKGKWTIIDS